MQRGKTWDWKYGNGAGRDDPERVSGEHSTLGGEAKAERAVKKVPRFAEGLGQERRPRCGGPKKLIVAGERKAGFKRGLRLPSSCDWAWRR